MTSKIHVALVGYIQDLLPVFNIDSSYAPVGKRVRKSGQDRKGYFRFSLAKYQACDIPLTIL